MRLNFTKTLSFVAALTALGCGGTPTVVDPDASMDAQNDTIIPPDARIDTINPPDARIDSSSDAAADVSPDAPQNFCAANPCMNGGTCTSGATTYTCACADGYEGTNCETNIDDCAPNPCMNGGTCEDGIDRYTCDCPAGFGGLECQDVLVSCTPNPCNNGGTCALNGGMVECTCADGYSGNTCDVNIDDCDPNPCVNGMCADGVDEYTCACSAGWMGTDCDMDINECDENPCANGGACMNSDGSYMCMCAAGWSGTNCDADINECDSAPCLNGGGCVNNDGSYMCMCPAGYDGMNCENNINECAGDPCQNGGTCMDGVDSYSCMCAAGYDGTNCENNINECSPNPCQNGGSCADGVNSFTCTCLPGSSGSTCATVSALSDCEAILAAAPASANGLYLIDPDSAGSIPAFPVYCDMLNGGWTQILDQDVAVAGGFRPSAEWLAGVTATAPNGGQWSVLQHMAAFAGNLGYRFRMTWDQNQARSLTWNQTSNPFLGRGTISGAVGVPVAALNACSEPFGGLAVEQPDVSAMNGNPNGCWYWAVGVASAAGYAGTIPTYGASVPEDRTDRGRLYFRRFDRPANCLGYLNLGATTNGAYSIDPDGAAGAGAPFNAFCDMTTSGGGWTLVFTKNSAHQASYPDIGAANVNLAALAQNPATTSSSASANTGWVNLNAFPYTNMRIVSYLNGAQTYTSANIARSSLRIAWGEDGYLLYNDSNGYYWCTGAASYMDGGVGQINRPAGAPANCKGHGSIGSGWDFGGTGANSGLTMCGADASNWMYGSFQGNLRSYPASGAAHALWVR